jgi:hypothetical protein
VDAQKMNLGLERIELTLRRQPLTVSPTFRTMLRKIQLFDNSAFDYTISKMKREFGSPMLDAHTIIDRIRDINVRLRHLGRELPRIAETRASEAKW